MVVVARFISVEFFGDFSKTCIKRYVVTPFD